jgi:hypothetical protein
MIAALLLDPKIAFLLLAGLIVGAAVPLAIGWARLLPAEKPPFEIENPRRRSAAPMVSIYGSEPEERKLDLVAIVLLVLLTVAFALQFPGVPRDVGLNSSLYDLPSNGGWAPVVLPCLMMLTCAVAIVYGAMRRTFLRMQLMAAGSVVLVLWVVGPWLYRELARI